jgi:hypothetical protein
MQLSRFDCWANQATRYIAVVSLLAARLLCFPLVGIDADRQSDSPLKAQLLNPLFSQLLLSHDGRNLKNPFASPEILTSYAVSPEFLQNVRGRTIDAAVPTQRALPRISFQRPPPFPILSAFSLA